MNLKDFKKYLNIYGANINRWPPEQQAGARELLEDSSEARALHEAGRSLDRALESFTVPDLPPQLSDRLARIPQATGNHGHTPRRRLSSRLRGMLALPALPVARTAVAAVVLVFILAGLLTSLWPPPTSQVTPSQHIRNQTDPVAAFVAEWDDMHALLRRDVAAFDTMLAQLNPDNTAPNGITSQDGKESADDNDDSQHTDDIDAFIDDLAAPQPLEEDSVWEYFMGDSG